MGEALEKLLYDDSTASQTYELFGPKNYSTAEIAALVDKEIFKKRRHINLPKKILKPAANILNKALWWPVLSADEIEREFIDQKIDPKAKTFKDLGIEPAELSSLTFHYLVSSIFLTFHTSQCCFPDPDITIAILSKRSLLRFTTFDRAREEGGEEIFACFGHPIETLRGVNLVE